MKKLIVLLFTLQAFAAPAQHMFDYSDMRSGLFAAKSVQGLRSMSDGEHYTIQVGNRIEQYRYRDGEAVGTIFDGDRHGSQFSGYIFSPDQRLVLVYDSVRPIYRWSFEATHYLYDRGNDSFMRLTSGREQSVCFAPDGKSVGFVRDNNIYIGTFGGVELHQVTHDGCRNHIINGHADWVYEEEYGLTRAFEFSPDSKKILYLRFIESQVPEYTMMYFRGNLYPEPYTFKYPMAGENNSVVELCLYDIESRTAERINTGEDTDQYIPRIGWTPDGVPFFYRVNRLQNLFEVLTVDADGISRVIYSESSRKYVERPDQHTVTFLDSNRLVVLNETSGYNHLYLYNTLRNTVDTITKGSWEVSRMVGIHGDRLYYISNEGSPLRNNLYSIKLNGRGKQRLTSGEGYYSVFPSEQFRYFITFFSNVKTPPVVSLHDRSGKTIRVLEDNAALRQSIESRRVPAKEFFTFTTIYGNTLNGYMVKPADLDPGRQYPVLMYQYSGPGSQEVIDRWRMDWTDVLVQEGYIIACVDGRGTGGRGRAFRQCTYGNLGALETEDQIEAAKYLATLDYVDHGRIGIYGWSYGGFMALNCILKGNDIFRTAVAVAPVTSWRYYDTIYTEIYNGLPEDNPAGYDNNSPINFADRLKGNLLIIHGTGDDNVHVRNTYEMVNSLVRHGKQFDLMIYPDDNHGMMPGGIHHVRETMIKYLLENL